MERFTARTEPTATTRSTHSIASTSAADLSLSLATCTDHGGTSGNLFEYDNHRYPGSTTLFRHLGGYHGRLSTGSMARTYGVP